MSDALREAGQDADRHVPATLAYADANLPEAPLSRGDVATLALRLLGIYLLIDQVPMLAQATYFVSTLGGPPGELMIAVMWILTPVVAGVGLIAFARPLGRLMLPPTSGAASSRPGLAYGEFHAALLMVLGLWLAITAGAQLLAVIVSLQQARRAADPWITGIQAVGEADGAWLAAIEPAVRLIAGIALVLGARGLVSLWHRLRHAEPPKVAE